MKDKKTLTIRIVIFAAIVIGIFIIMKLIVGAADVSARYEGFAQCLKDKGVRMYGAFWCPHCQAEERALGISRQKLENMGLYVECSNPNRSQTEACKEKNIESYPTWIFPDGTKRVGYDEKDPGGQMQGLAEKSGCVLPSADVEAK